MPDSLIDVAPDFDDPVSVLRFCHARMRKNLQLLRDLYGHARQQGMDEQVRAACDQVRRYFSEAAPLHHLDEEQDLFPLLITTDASFKGIIDDLTQQHQTLNKNWQQLQPLLANPARLLHAPHVERLIDNFCQSYTAHLQQEEEYILERAPKVLNAEMLQTLGMHMRKRREAAHA